MKRFFQNPLSRTIALGAGVLGILAVVTFLVQHDIETRLRSLQSTYARQAEKTKVIETIAKLKREAVPARAYANALRVLIPNEDGAIGIQKSFRDLARAQKVTSSFSFLATQEPAETALGSIGFQLTVSGTLSRVDAFLDAIRTLPLLVSVESVELALGANEAVSASMQGKVFFH